MELEDALDALYAATPEDFVGLRGRLLAEAKAAKQRDRVEALKAARKPTTTAWVVNVLARRRADELGRLFDAHDATRRAHAALLAGGGAEEMRDSVREEREALARLLRSAREVLAERGQELSAQQQRRIEENLRGAAAGDEALRATVRRGRLAADLDADADVALGSVDLAAALRASARSATPSAEAAPAGGAPGPEPGAAPAGAGPVAASTGAHTTEPASDDARLRAEAAERADIERRARERHEAIAAASLAVERARARASDRRLAASGAEREATRLEGEARAARERVTVLERESEEAASEVARAEARLAELSR